MKTINENLSVFKLFESRRKRTIVAKGIRSDDTESARESPKAHDQMTPKAHNSRRRRTRAAKRTRSDDTESAQELQAKRELELTRVQNIALVWPVTLVRFRCHLIVSFWRTRAAKRTRSDDTESAQELQAKRERYFELLSTLVLVWTVLYGINGREEN